MVNIELHSRKCACRGTGWISSPGIGPKMHECHSPNAVFIPVAEWVRIGRPVVIEDCPKAHQIIASLESLAFRERNSRLSHDQNGRKSQIRRSQPC